MSQITEDYIGFSTAKLLKEKGFDAPTTSYWELISNPPPSKAGQFEVKGTIRTWYKNDEKEKISNPTQALILKWLRVEHGIHIFTDFGIGWGYMIIPVGYSGEGKFPKFTENFESPEEATEAAILYSLKNLVK